MTIPTKHQCDFIDRVAIQLAKYFIGPLLELNSEKNYSKYIEGLAEILVWSKEFYDLYYYKTMDWEMFKKSNDNIYNAETLEDLIIDFGFERLENYYTKKKTNVIYFENYSSIKY
jgi:hypothetical protein